MSAASSTSTHLFQNFLGNFQSRKLLLQISLNNQQEVIAAAAAAPHSPGDNSFDSDSMTVLLVLFCAVFISVGLASLIKCSLSCSRSSAASDPSTTSSARFGNKGITKNALKTLAVVKYSGDLKLPGLDTECVICLSDFSPGERVRLLPKCNHGFHVRCIDKWLSTNSSCPKCRHCLNEICEKIGVYGESGASSSVASAAVQETVVSVVSVEPEHMVCNYR